MLLPISRLIYYITFWSFCQVFLKTFSNQLFQCDCHSEKRLNYCTTTCPICQVFFSKAFQTQLWIICFADDLFIISLPDDFVKCFLNFFQKNFWKLVFQSPKTSFWKGFRPTALLLYHENQILSNKKIPTLFHLICRIFTKNYFIV